MIKLRYSCPGFAEVETFKTLASAQRWAYTKLGPAPRVTDGEAHGAYGVVSLVEGPVLIDEVFPGARHENREYGLGYMQGRGAA